MSKPHVRKCLIISPAGDEHALCVADRITKLAAGTVTPHIVDFATYPQVTDLSYHLPEERDENYWDIAVASPWPRVVSNRAIDLSRLESAIQTLDTTEIVSVWFRRPRKPAITTSIKNNAHRLHAANASSDVIKTFSQFLYEKCNAFNAPQSEARAELKPYQLWKAKSAGFNVPETLITTSPQKVENFYRDVQRMYGSEVVYKMTRTDPTTVVPTRKLTDDVLKYVESARYGPTTFQRYIEGVDIRVAIVARNVFAVAQYPEDQRRVYDIREEMRTKHKEMKVPPREEEKLHSLHQALGLVVASYDFKMDEEGTWYFLEVNPAGQWLWLETECRLPVSEAIAAYMLTRDPSMRKRMLPTLSGDEVEKMQQPLIDVYMNAIRE